jgi:hypothetical protein
MRLKPILHRSFGRLVVLFWPPKGSHLCSERWGIWVNDISGSTYFGLGRLLTVIWTYRCPERAEPKAGG